MSRLLHAESASCPLVCPQEALDNLMLDGDNIVSAARRAIMRHDYSAVLTIFPILRHLKMNKSEFDSTLQVCISSVSLSFIYMQHKKNL